MDGRQLSTLCCPAATTQLQTFDHRPRFSECSHLGLLIQTYPHDLSAGEWATARITTIDSIVGSRALQTRSRTHSQAQTLRQTIGPTYTARSSNTLGLMGSRLHASARNRPNYGCSFPSRRYLGAAASIRSTNLKPTYSLRAYGRRCSLLAFAR